MTTTSPIVLIDGSHGEGGGQIVRTALALSAITGRPFRMVNIRRGRPRPGLQPQHIAALRAAAAVCDARVSGMAQGSTELLFYPGRIHGGDLEQNTGTAGSVSLVLQTLIPPLLFADGPSRVRLTGGTHVPWSPSWHYLAGVFNPMLALLGVSVSLESSRCGFYPAGGGVVTALVEPVERLRPARLVDPGEGPLRIAGVSGVGRLPQAIAVRQRDAAIAALRKQLGDRVSIEIETRIVAAAGPGSFIFLRSERGTAAAGFCALGARGKPAEAVGEEAARDLLAHIATRAPVDPHLADQLVPYLALADGPSELATSCITRHLLTNLWTALQFLHVRGDVTGEVGSPGRVRIEGCRGCGGRARCWR